MFRLTLLLAILFTLFSCSGPSQPANQASPVPTDSLRNQPDSFFPVTSYLKGQLITIDSLPVTPLYTVSVDGKTDSSWLSKPACREKLGPFLEPEIGETNLVPLFRETSFNDQTLNAITFTYEPSGPLPDSMTLQGWNVYIDPQKNSVSKIYLVKTDRQKQHTYQLLWKAGYWAKITTIENKPGGQDKVVKEEKITWNFTAE